MVLTQALSYTALAVVAALVGGVVAVYFPPGPQMESNIQHFAAGVVTAAVAAELLPGIHDRAPEIVIVGFAAGVVTMLGIHQLSKRIEKRNIGGQFAGAAGLLITVGIDMVIDGVLIGVTFLDNPDTGVIIAVALAIEVLFLGVAGVVALPDGVGWARSWRSRRRSDSYSRRA
jgi:ZIP family zinc transporter